MNLHSLELRRLYTDLFYCYKILFGLVDLQASDFFEWAPCQNTRGHKFKLYKKAVLHESDLWNSLLASVDFCSFHSFKRIVKLIDLSAFLRSF